MKLNLKEHWMLYAVVVGGAFLAYQLYSAGESAGTTAAPALTPGQQALQSQDMTLLNQLAQPDYNPANYVVPPTPVADTASLIMLAAAFTGAYMIYGG